MQTGLFGRLSKVAALPGLVRLRAPRFAGVGSAPEGLSDAYAPVELLAEQGWDSASGLGGNVWSWIEEFSVRR